MRTLRTVRAAFSAVCSDRPWPSMSRSSSARSSCRFCWVWAPGSCTTCCGRCGCGTPRLTAPLDLLYCQAVGLAVFLFVLRQSDGQLRGFILLGGLGGGVLFFSLLSRPLRPVWDFWMDRWMELFQFLSLPGRFCAAVCKKFAFQAKTLFYFLRKYATIHIEGVWKPLRKGGMSHGKARQTRKKEKIR